MLTEQCSVLSAQPTTVPSSFGFVSFNLVKKSMRPAKEFTTVNPNILDWADSDSARS